MPQPPVSSADFAQSSASDGPSPGPGASTGALRDLAARLASGAPDPDTLRLAAEHLADYADLCALIPTDPATGLTPAAAEVVRRNLQSGEERLRRLLRTLEQHIDNSPLAVTEWGDDFRWRRWSAGAERIFGYRADEMIGRSFLDTPFIYHEDRPRIQAQIEQLLSGAITRFSATNRNVCRDGRVIWCEWHNSALLDEDGRLVSVLSQTLDITARVQAEQELRRAVDRLEAHLDNAPTAVVEWGPDFRFTRWSAGATRLFGWTEQEMIGRRFDLLSPPLIAAVDMDRAMAHTQELLSGRSRRASLLARNHRKDGALRWVHWHSSSLFDENGRLVSVLSQGADVTERVLADQRVRESERRFRQLADSAPAMIWLSDATGYRTFLSQEWYAFTGQSPETALGFGWADAVHPDDREQLRHRALEAFARRKPRRYEYRLRRADGAYGWVIDAATPRFGDDGQFLGYVGSMFDITDRRHAENALRESEQRFRVIFDLTTVGMAEIDARTLRFIAANQEFRRITGYSQSELLKLTPVDLIHPDDRAAGAGNRQAIQRGEVVQFTAERRLVRQNGQVISVVFTANTLRDASGRPDRVVGALIDITDRVRAENALRAAKESAEAASRAKDRFIATLSHELRTPLTPVRAMLSFLVDDPRLPDDARRDLQLVLANVRAECKLIDDLLDMTRLARGQVQVTSEPCDLHALAARAVESAGVEAETRNLTIVAALDADQHRVSADPQRLTQVLWNLVGNAVKFTPAGGRIEVRTDNPAPDRVRLRVIDSGVGIPPERLKLIFEPFERGETRHRYEYTGLGLGLSIARSLLELMHGTIEAHSDGPDRGATFTITLPLAAATLDPPASGDAPGAQPPPAHPAAGLRVLIVEDDKATGEVLARLLNRCGCAAQVARSAATARQLLTGDDRRDAFDLLLCDIGLPDGTGHDLLRGLRGAGVATPAVALSGYGMPGDINASLEAGFVEHLTKPVDFSVLQAAIARFARRRPDDRPPVHLPAAES